MSTEKVLSQVKFEIEQIDQLLDKYKVLLDSCKRNPPDLIQITALGSVLHSFYNGIENIFSTIAKKIDNSMPIGLTWHTDLLIQMANVKGKRGQVINIETKELLAEYLGFRHFYRHSYSFYIEWDELEKLVISLLDVWDKAKTEINLFLDKNIMHKD